MLVGLTALSVEIKTNFFVLFFIEISTIFFVPIILFFNVELIEYSDNVHAYMQQHVEQYQVYFLNILLKIII